MVSRAHSLKSSGPDPQTDPSLRSLIERHRVRVTVYRELGPDAAWQPHAVGFELELRGLVLGDHPFGDSAAHRVAHDVLVQVACWALRDLEGSGELTYVIDDFAGHVLAEGAGGAVTVELTAHVIHREDARRELDDKERDAVQGVRGRLLEAGVQG